MYIQYLQLTKLNVLGQINVSHGNLKWKRYVDRSSEPSIKQDCGHFMSKNLRYGSVHSLVMHYFSYCDVIYGDMTTALESKLQRAQNSCVRFICGIKKFDHISKSFEELNMPRLEQIRRVSLLKLGWKILKGEAPT